MLADPPADPLGRDHAWIEQVRAQYRKFVYHSDVVELRGTVTGTRVSRSSSRRPTPGWPHATRGSRGHGRPPGPRIRRHGGEQQKKHWLPRLYCGEQIACQLFSEPGAGSDLASVRTQAVREGDGWRISGQKVWTSGAHLADVGEIICRTADQPRPRNLAAFLMDMHADGVTVRLLRQMTGGRASTRFSQVMGKRRDKPAWRRRWKSSAPKG